MPETREIGPVDVSSDPNLGPKERETALNWARRDERVRVFCEEPALIRKLLRNPSFETRRVRTDGGDIVAVAGTVPIGAVRVTAKPAKTSRHSKVHTDTNLHDTERTVPPHVEEAVRDQPDGWVEVGGPEEAGDA
jgi:hypothetical protein